MNCLLIFSWICISNCRVSLTNTNYNFFRIMDPESCFATHFIYMSHDYCHGADDHMIIKIHYGGITRFLLVFLYILGNIYSLNKMLL